MRRRGIHESSDHQRREKERTGRYVISQTGRPAILAKGAYASAFRIVQNLIKKDAVESGGEWFHRRRQPGLSLFLIHSFKFHQSVFITIFQRRVENNDLIPIQRIRSRSPHSNSRSILNASASAAPRAQIPKPREWRAQTPAAGIRAASCAAREKRAAAHSGGAIAAASGSSSRTSSYSSRFSSCASRRAQRAKRPHRGRHSAVPRRPARHRHRPRAARRAPAHARDHAERIGGTNRQNDRHRHADIGEHPLRMCRGTADALVSQRGHARPRIES